ncbi:DUF58 domain-containing protein [Methylosinus sp. H3A]|uniref:DUF58 domain-containing protein n=1 Tax=Methylosinus sp. H3A TaxID=2785786 RepID=UPI0018C1DCF9|nr:DUF58 domain-containing protein [Methylosinus sp. H3A]MBG0810105.1 DUF58 domain-containing protein [Methylosinus sp. H3A]
MAERLDIAYRPRGRVSNGSIGAHGGVDVGGIGVFRDHARFIQFPDARRIDIRATMRDPIGETHVRRFEQRNSIDVYALVDLSASMGFHGAARRLDIVADLCAALAFSATRIGDRFGLVACDETLRGDLLLPATRARGAAMEAAERMRGAQPRGASAQGLTEAAGLIAGRRKLVLLVSDFRWPAGFAARLFGMLAQHDLAPILIGDSAEERDLPRFGLVELDDLESGARRLVLMRPGLRRRWIAREAERRDALRRLALAHGRPPFVISDAFDADALSRHLLGL